MIARGWVTGILSAFLGLDENGTLSVTPLSRDVARRGPYAGYIPNVAVLTHEERHAKFYDDLIWGKRVIINCVAFRDGNPALALANLAQVQGKISGLGVDTFIYTVTVDPKNDRPQELRKLAKSLRAREGWLFLTGEPSGLALLRQRLFGASGDCAQNTSALCYGNEEAGLWGRIPAHAEPQSILDRLSWIKPGERTTGALRRRGPPPLPKQV